MRYPTQIAFALKQAELGALVSEVCRKLGITEQTFNRWKSKYGGMRPSDMKRLRQLEEENVNLKKLVADLSLDMLMLQDELTKNSKVCREAGCRALSAGTLSSNRTQELYGVRINRGWHRRQPTRDEQAFLRMRIGEIASAGSEWISADPRPFAARGGGKSTTSVSTGYTSRKN